MIEKIRDYYNKGYILGVNFNGIEFLGTNPDKKHDIKIFLNDHSFMPKEVCSAKLSEDQINDILDSVGNDIFICDDRDYENLARPLYRYFCKDEPKKAHWTNDIRKSELD